MNVATAKTPQKRMEKQPFQNLGIIGYGKNNLYPQELLEIVAASESAVSCRNRRTSFIEGNGFLDVQFSEKIVNHKGETADDLLRSIAEDVSNFDGFAIHVNYNMLGEAVSFTHVPFENCRLCEPDDADYVSKIAVHPDWTGRSKRNGRTLKVDKSNIDYVHIYNPSPEVVVSQIENAGGIGLYKGQILWVGKGKQTYPIPSHDSAVSYMSTEEGIGNIVNRNVRNGFNPSAILIVKKGVNFSSGQDEGNQNRLVNSAMPETSETQELVNRLAEARGDENSSNIMVFEIADDSEMPKLEKMQGVNYDKEFTVTTETCERKIYSVFKQDFWYRAKVGSIGLSGDMINDAWAVYSSETGSERRLIERAFDRLFKNSIFTETNNFTIQPQKYESPNNNINT